MNKKYFLPKPVLTIPINIAGPRPNVSLVVCKSEDFRDFDGGAAPDLFRVMFRTQRSSGPSPYVKMYFQPGGRKYFFMPMAHVTHMARYIMHRGLRIDTPEPVYNQKHFVKGATVRASVLFRRGERKPKFTKTRIAAVREIFGIPCFSLVGDAFGYRALHELELA